MRSGPATQTAFAMREFLAAWSALSCQNGRDVFQRGNNFGCQLRCAFALESAVAAYRAGWLRSRHARPFLRRPQRPGAHDAFTLWEPLGNSPSALLPQALGKTVAEPALRDHWQRDCHACSDC